jgi:uncharacterized protein YdhG (YjbR/CyaY superfamily)
MKSPGKPSRKPSAAASKREAFTEEERAAMRERAEESKAADGDGEAQVLEKIAQMRDTDRAMAERLHGLIRTHAPSLAPRTWYGIPAYAKDGRVVCFFQAAAKFKTRYATLGFSDKARLDEGRMWPIGFALKELGPAEEARIVSLVRQALG